MGVVVVLLRFLCNVYFASYSLVRLVNMKLKEQHILKDSFKYSYDTIADIAPPINRYYSQHCYNPPPMNSVLRGRNRNAIFSKSPHGPIFKFLWWFVKWLSENGTNPNTGEFLTLISHCANHSNKKNKWPNCLFYIGPSVVVRLTRTTFFGNSSRINKTWQKRVFKNRLHKRKSRKK